MSGPRNIHISISPNSINIFDRVDITSFILLMRWLPKIVLDLCPNVVTIHLHKILNDLGCFHYWVLR